MTPTFFSHSGMSLIELVELRVHFMNEIRDYDRNTQNYTRCSMAIDHLTVELINRCQTEYSNRLAA